MMNFPKSFVALGARIAFVGASGDGAGCRFRTKRRRAYPIEFRQDGRRNQSAFDRIEAYCRGRLS